MTHTLINIKEGVARHPDYRLAAPVTLSLVERQPLAIVGPNGGGKSLLADMLTGAHPCLGLGVGYHFRHASPMKASEAVRLVTFRDVYGGYEPAYYQQRWNRADEQQFPTVGEVLSQAARAWTDGHAGAGADEAPLHALWAETGIAEHLHKPVNLLSSGELRRLQLSKMLLSHPEVLIIDNPYIGLDREARSMLTRLLGRLSSHLTLVLIVSRAEDVPPFIQTVVPVSDKRVGAPISLSDYLAAEREKEKEAGAIELPEAAREGAEDASKRTEDAREGTEAASKGTEGTSEDVIDFRRITIRYGERTILKDLSWQVRRGEHWALTGENGAGKSTLLSLVCADNPQGYACDISLFGHRRGRGESIWDIKRRIGYVSPEIYSTYRRPLPVLDIVASGLADTIGLYRRPSEADRRRCREWLRVFGAEHLADRGYLTLSSGEQRLVLLVRAFVKSPDLLILDEPFHGLDNALRQRARAVIDAYMRRPDKTLIMVTHYEEELPACIDHHLTLRKNV